MACVKLEGGAVHRVRSEVNTLWRKAVLGDTMVDCTGGPRVGGFPITTWNADDDPLRKNSTNSDDLVNQHSLVMKNKVGNLMEEIDELKCTVEELTQVVQAAGDSFTLMNVSEHYQADSVASQVARIKRQIHCIKEEGKKVYCDLEREETELEKDVKALRVVVSEEFHSTVEKRCGEINSVRRKSDNKVYNKWNIKRSEHKVSNVKEIENTSTTRVPTNKMLPREKVNSVAYFKHNWDEKDHIQFVRIYQRHKLKHKQMQEWQRMFPYKTENDIFDHASAYETYVKEKEKVKNQIIQWKSEREEIKKECQKRLGQEKLENENKVKLMSKAKEERRKEERNKRMERLEEWKSRKNEDSVDRNIAGVFVDKAEQKLIKSPQRKIKGVKFTDEERADMAVQLHLYRLQKEKLKQKEIQKKQEELQFKKLYSISSRKELFRKRDEQYINHKKEQKELQVRMKEEQIKRLEGMKSVIQIKAESNKDRLFKPTLSHTAYKLSSQIRETFRANVDQIPQLATPAWRQEI